jgi:hypothetical protein
MARRKRFSLNVLIAVLLVAVNAWAWVSAAAAIVKPYEVEAVRDPEVAQLLDYIHTGSHSGEAWQVTLTEGEAEQTITWYLKRYPQIPFAHPRIRMTPDWVSGEGDAVIAGLRVHVGARVRITLVDGLPRVEILDLSLPLPGPVRAALEQELQVQLKRADQLPVRFSSAEWREGEVVVRGVIR